MFENLITGLCRDIGLEPPVEGTDGALYLQVNDLEIGIFDEAENESLLFQCTVGTIGGEIPGEMLMDIAEANYYWSATNGATLGFNSASGEVVLVKEWALAGLDQAKLTRLAEDFVVAAEFWCDRIAGGTSTESPAPSPTLERFNPMATMIRG